MTKYSFNFKLKIVHNYLSGQGGAPFLAKKYEFKNSSQIRKWINIYLKELRRLRLDNEQETKKSRESFTASEDNF
ncbi:transposase [Listeria monocytogenes]|nr:transposase [Listeria monocytogenes]